MRLLIPKGRWEDPISKGKRQLFPIKALNAPKMPLSSILKRWNFDDDDINIKSPHFSFPFSSLLFPWLARQHFHPFGLPCWQMDDWHDLQPFMFASLIVCLPLLFCSWFTCVSRVLRLTAVITHGRALRFDGLTSQALSDVIQIQYYLCSSYLSSSSTRSITASVAILVRVSITFIHIIIHISVGNLLL